MPIYKKSWIVRVRTQVCILDGDVRAAQELKFLGAFEAESHQKCGDSWVMV